MGRYNRKCIRQQGCEEDRWPRLTHKGTRVPKAGVQMRRRNNNQEGTWLSSGSRSTCRNEVGTLPRKRLHRRCEHGGRESSEEESENCVQRGLTPVGSGQPCPQTSHRLSMRLESRFSIESWRGEASKKPQTSLSMRLRKARSTRAAPSSAPATSAPAPLAPPSPPSCPLPLVPAAKSANSSKDCLPSTAPL